MASRRWHFIASPPLSPVGLRLESTDGDEFGAAVLQHVVYAASDMTGSNLTRGSFSGKGRSQAPSWLTQIRRASERECAGFLPPVENVSVRHMPVLKKTPAAARLLAGC